VSEHEIIPRLWQGGCTYDGGIVGHYEAIVCCVPQPYCLCCPTAPEHDHLFLPMGVAPAMYLPATWRLEQAATFVARHVKLGHRTLVHCEAGLNRSGLIVALSLIRGWGMDAQAAIDLIRQRRGQYALCNHEFTAWLVAYGAAANARPSERSTGHRTMGAETR
jgi:hypothetical protein